VSAARILLAEDSEATRARLGAALRASGYTVIAARDGAEALARFEREPVDLVLSDQRMPRLDGLGLLRAVRARTAVPFVLYSAGPEPDLAWRAARLGAVGCLSFPFRVEEQLLPTIAASLGARAADTEKRRGAARFLGASPAAARVRARIARLAPLRATILVLGETGVGKEVVARALHEASGRSLWRSFAVTELAETLLEAELFGHERGAFTGAVTARPGLFEQADGGTLLLDEIGDAPPALQAKLLRVLETGELRRVGGSGSPRLVDVRVVAATHRDLAAEVRAGRFRRDLYYRLAEAVVAVPPLRERAEDVETLAHAFLAELAAAQGVPVPTASPDFFAALRAHAWPGNARELRAALQSALLWWDGRAPLAPTDLAEALAAPLPDPVGDPLSERMLAAWRAAGGNQEAARRALGLSRAAWRHRWEQIRRSGR